MSTKFKAGKKPVSQKRTRALINPDEIFNSGLSVPPEIKAHAEKEGWELRYVNGTDLVRNGGQHKRGWIPYLRPKDQPLPPFHLKFGNDPDGIVRQGDSILAYRPKTQGDKHRAFNKQRADQLAGTFRKEANEELREAARNTGLRNIEVLEGYDESDD